MMAIGLVTILTFFFVLNLRGEAPHPKTVVAARMDVANDLVVSFNSAFLPSAIRTSGKKAVVGLTKEIASTNSFISNVSGNLSLIIISGNMSPTKQILLPRETLKYKLESFANKSRDVLHTTFDFTINSMEVIQDNRTGGFRVGVELNLSYLANNTLAIWNKTSVYFIDFEITEMKDPLYIIGAQQTVNNTIKEAGNESWELSHFQEHVLEGTYKLEPLAPSFLQRFENDTSGSECCGIESIFYNATLYPPFVSRNLSYVDYCFFTNVCTDIKYGAYLYNITGISTADYPFRIRAYHIGVTKYNITANVDDTV